MVYYAKYVNGKVLVQCVTMVAVIYREITSISLSAAACDG